MPHHEQNGFRRTMSAGTLIGDKVLNMDGQELGKVEEIMLDVLTGRVSYVVLSFGGLLGVGDKLFALPWEALELSEEEHAFFVDIDKGMLEDAPGFDKDNWPEHPTHQWLTGVYDYYGYEPWW